ncbi:lanthionine synthetase C family protein [Actinocorallia sp. A-T 12471]|uniref:lanthionine synthetase C family protein n=1 Tax=Actinocorallia sp. A-T 12471 TaxID=3089813 RepID=UPI0029D3E5F2|nr:lanthionine synthetase C family protein [Actinocorallia sp. A-T 12471]MDX6742933.1 lanthionine synthetase C family protein [Actinocorallia sp. A-T 12471]
MTEPNPDALDAADKIAASLTDPETAWPNSHPRTRAWPQSLAGGAAGIALLHIERALAGRGDWATVQRWLKAATRDELTAATNAGLFVGASALGFVLHAASQGGRFSKALSKLDETTINLTRSRLADADSRIKAGAQPEMKEFDLIRGLTGLGIYHLRHHPEHPITRDVLTYLVRLTEPLPGTAKLPPWWTEVSPNGDPAPEFPGGHGNLGVAHGIGAVIALLSLAELEGHPIPGSPEAIQRLCSWTDRWRQDDASLTWWPGYIDLAQHERGTIDRSSHPRPSWCYGIGGTARAQQLAGMALHDLARQRDAEDALLRTLREPDQLLRLPDAGLCHGMAGLLHVSWRVASDAQSPDLTHELGPLTERLIEMSTDVPGDPEFLDGAAGVALALHTIGTAQAPRSAWDSVLLLA